MNDSAPLLASRLTPDRPAVLLLGQKAMTFADGIDHFLARISKAMKLGTDLKNYRDLVSELGGHDQGEFDGYLRRLATDIGLPQVFGSLSSFPWNAVYTTIPLTAVCNAFHRPWREVQPVRNAEYVARGQRNTRRLNLVQVFGDYGVTDSRETAPFSEEDWERRDDRAVPRLLDHLESLVTPIGTLVIDGFEPDSDWLEFKRLRTRLAEAQVGQIHWFSFPSALIGDRLVKRLVADSKLFCYPASLLDELGDEWQGIVRQAQESLSLYTTRYTLKVHGKTVAIPEALWRQIHATGTIMHKDIGEDPQKANTSKDPASFRSFLKDSANGPVWWAHRAAIPYRRAYEDKLHDRVINALRQGVAYDWPIILHGASATGKSVALAALAHRVSQNDEYPVLYFGFGDGPTDTDAIVRFWQEFLAATEAKSLLVIWDGMKELKTYTEILRRLSKEGLPVVLVGSHYVLKRAVQSLPREAKRSLIEATNALDDKERETFLDYLRGYGLKISNGPGPMQPDERFWVLLYRLSVPELNDQLVKALYGEETRAIEVIKKHLQLRAREQPMSQIAAQLLQIFPEYASSANIVEYAQGSMNMTAGQVLFALVMVAAQYGHGVPMELLVRADNAAGGLRGSYRDLESVLQAQDIIRIGKDRKSRLVVDARHRVEARELIRSLTNLAGEVNLLVTLIRALQRGSWTLEDEIEFLSELLRDIGPRGDIASKGKNKYSRFYLEISDALRFVREEKDIIHPSLVLKESFFVRQWLRANHGSARDETLMEKGTTVGLLLSQAEEALVEVLDSDIRLSNDQLVTLLTERGTLAGFRAVESHAETNNLDEARSLFWGVWPYLFKALDLSPGNYQPVDVMEWVGREMLPLLASDTERAKVMKQVWEALDRINAQDLPQDQMGRYLTARDDFSKATGQNPIDPAVYDEMISAGNPVGLYCRAWTTLNPRGREIGGFIVHGVTEEQRRREREVFDLLWQHRDLAAQDRGCLNLLRRTWWVSTTGSRLMRGEKERVGLSQGQWQELLSVLGLYDPQLLDQEPLNYYLSGLAYWHLRRPVEGDRMFKLAAVAARNVQGLGSIRRYHIMCGETGDPLEFTGIIRKLANGRGEVEVSGMGVRIPFKMGRGNFRDTDLRVDDALPRFYIAFNYEGAIADPPGYVDQGTHDGR